MTPEIESLRHDLIRKVPEMLRGFTIHTNYGEIEISPDDAMGFHDFTKKFFEEKIKTELMSEACQPATQQYTWETQIFDDLPECPKCRELLSSPKMEILPDNKGRILAYNCPACQARYMFTPVTTFHLAEIH